MSAALLSSLKIQTDMAGLTKAVREEFRTAGTTATEVYHSLIHGESGSLHYLWDSLPLGVVDHVAVPEAPPGPHGGGTLPFGSLRPQGAPPSPFAQPVVVPVGNEPHPGNASAPTAPNVLFPLFHPTEGSPV